MNKLAKEIILRTFNENKLDGIVQACRCEESYAREVLEEHLKKLHDILGYPGREQALLDIYYKAEEQDNWDVMIEVAASLDKETDRQAKKDEELMRLGACAKEILNDRALKETGFKLQ